MLRRTREMEIYAKSQLALPNTQIKIDIGTDGIELQLLAELVNGKLGNYLKADDVFNLDELDYTKISAVHAPILSHYGLCDVNIESLCDSFDGALMEEVFYIANYYGEKQKKMIRVIIHSEADLDALQLIGDTWKRIQNYTSAMLFKYPYTLLCIENVTPIRNISNGPLHLCNNFKFDNVRMVRELRKLLQTDRIYTVLDTCHAMLTDKYMGAIYREIGDLPKEDYSLENFFRQNADVVGLIHLSTYSGNGGGKGHGIAFTEETYPQLCEILDLYEKYNYSCPITLEVREDNYLVCDQYKQTRDLVLRYLAER